MAGNTIKQGIFYIGGAVIRIGRGVFCFVRGVIRFVRGVFGFVRKVVSFVRGVFRFGGGVLSFGRAVIRYFSKEFFKNKPLCMKNKQLYYKNIVWMQYLNPYKISSYHLTSFH